MESSQDAIAHKLGGIPLLNDGRNLFVFFLGEWDIKESLIKYKHRFSFPQKMAGGH